MTYRVNILPPAQEDLSYLDATAIRRVLAKLKWLSDNSQNITHKMLSGKLRGLYKLRAVTA